MEKTSLLKTSLLSVFKDYAANTPDALFAADESGSVTYGEAFGMVSGAAAFLDGLGIQRGDRVLVSCTQNRQFLLAAYACQLAGAVFVPLEHNMKQDRIGRILSDTEAAAGIFPEGGEGTELLAAAGARVVLFNELFACEGEENGEEAAIFNGDASDFRGRLPEKEETAEILYTTGTTGASKGIEITHANNIALAENICFGTGMREGNVELVPLPLSHSHGLRTCYANLYRGGAVLITDGVSKVKMVYDLVANYRATALDLSPTAASVLLRLSRGKFADFSEQLDYIEIGTAALPEELKSQLIKQFPGQRLYNFYGSTESGRSCVLNFNSGDDRKFCIGFPSKNARFIITGDDGSEIDSSAEKTGLLACAGAMNMKGYWKQPALTEEVLRNGILYTKDEGYLDEDGRVYCLGRKDDVINYRGIKIAPEEIEEKALKFRGVEDCALIGLPDAASGQIPVLCYKARPGKVEEPAFSKYLAEVIEKEYLPKKLLFVEEIPRTSNGKLRRGALRELVRSGQA